MMFARWCSSSGLHSGSEDHPAGCACRECAVVIPWRSPLCSWRLALYPQLLMGTESCRNSLEGHVLPPWLDFLGFCMKPAAAPLPTCSRVITEAALVNCSGPGSEVVIQLLKSFLCNSRAFNYQVNVLQNCRRKGS